MLESLEDLPEIPESERANADEDNEQISLQDVVDGEVESVSGQ